MNLFLFCVFFIKNESFLAKLWMACTRIHKSSRLEFLEKCLVNNFASSYAEDNNSRLLNSEGRADLPLLRTLLAICQPSFWDVMDSLFHWHMQVWQLQCLLACLNFTLDSEGLLSWFKQKSDFYEL